jgi:hypothetical protein
MRSFVNSSPETRSWSSLVNPETGRTLELGPGEKVSLDVPASFDDPFLHPVKDKPAEKPEPKVKSDETAVAVKEHNA